MRPGSTTSLLNQKEQKTESNFFSGEDNACCVLGFKGYHSPGLSHWLKNHQCAVLLNSPERKVKSAIRLKRRKMQDSVCFLKDNVRPHTAALTIATLLKLKWNVLPHPLYSPDLAPYDYHLFGPMKRVLGGKRFQNNDEVIATVQSWIHKQQKTFFETGNKKLPQRWNKCMAVNRDYIEK
jgi:hypothetical protein